jgi:hypothetical protein
VSRLEPLIRAESNQEVIVVFANRCGIEGEATYAGTSAVVGIQSGEIWVYGIMGRGETGLLVVDTESEPYARLSYQPLQPNIRSEDDASPDLEKNSGNGPYQHNESHDQSREDYEKSSKAPIDSSTDQQEDDLHMWLMGNSIDPDVRQNHQSSEYNKEYVNHTTNKPQAENIQRSSSSKLNINSLQLDIPPDQYMLRRYLEAESPISHLDSFKPPNQSATAPPEELRGSRKDRDDYVAFYPDMMEDEKRFSLRSDVSVYYRIYRLKNGPGLLKRGIAPDFKKETETGIGHIASGNPLIGIVGVVVTMACRYRDSRLRINSEASTAIVKSTKWRGVIPAVLFYQSTFCNLTQFHK